MMTTFETLQRALLKIAVELADDDAQYASACPDYQRHMAATRAALIEARSFADLAAVDWVQGQAALCEEINEGARA